MVCRVFKKKNTSRGYQQEIEEEDHIMNHMRTTNAPCHNNILEPKHHHHMQQQQGLLYDYNNNNNSFDATIHLPQLFSPESAVPPPPPTSFPSSMDILECSQNLLRLTTPASSGLNLMQQQGERFHGDWSFLDKLLASHNGIDHHHTLRNKCNTNNQHGAAPSVETSAHKFPFHYLGCHSHHDIMKFSK